jgi:hypothetical protein
MKHPAILRGVSFSIIKFYPGTIAVLSFDTVCISHIIYDCPGKRVVFQLRVFTVFFIPNKKGCLHPIRYFWSDIHSYVTKNKRMKTKNLLLGIAVPLFTFLILFGCKKQELQTPEPMDNTPLIKNAVQRSQDQLARTASAKDQSNLKAITADLDYTLAAKLPLGDTAVLYVVHLLSKKPGGTEKFYSVVQKLDDYSFDGIYEAKNIETIKSLFKAGYLAKTDSVYVRSASGNPTQAWVTSARGTVNHLVANGFKKRERSQQKNMLSTSRMRLNIVDDNPENCVEWWMCEWDPEYGWVPLYYLFTVGCENLNQPPTGPTPIENACFTQEAAEQLASSLETETFGFDGSISVGEEVVDPVTGYTEKDFSPNKWKFFSTTLPGWFRLDYSAQYGGKIYRESTYDVWKYKEVKFLYSERSYGTVPTCLAFTFNVTDSGSEIYDAGRGAKSTLHYWGQVSVSCLGGMELGDPRSDDMTVYWGTPTGAFIARLVSP